MPVSFAWCDFYLFLVVMVPRGKVGFELVLFFLFLWTSESDRKATGVM